MSELRLAVCILFYEKLEQTIECIRSFLPSGINVYVLNNNSSQSARDKLGAFCADFKQVKIIDSGINLGVGVGRNHLISNTTEDWLLFVDNDITISTREWVKTITEHIDNNDDSEVFIPRLYNKHEGAYVHYNTLEILKGKAVLTPANGSTTNMFPGGASFVNRRLFERLGFYDDKIFVGAEDFELALRGVLDKSPVKAELIDDIELIHDHRLAKEKTDVDAVLSRYDVNTIEKSYDRIMEKHNIKLEDGWKPWVKDQAKKMVIKDKPWQKIANKIIPESLRRNLEIFQGKRVVPSSCTLFMTDRCNFKCAGCSRNTIGVKKSKEIELATVEKLALMYPTIKSYCIAGLGEPTLCTDFVDIVNFLVKNKNYVGIITNGTNLDKLLDLEYEPNYISISLYGADNETYKSYCGVAVFDKVISNFIKLKSRYPSVGFSFIVNKENYKTLDSIFTLCDELQPDFLHLVNYLVYNIDDENEINRIITVNDKEVIDEINELCKDREYVKAKPQYIDLEQPSFNCKSYKSLINLDGSGNIGGCQRQIPPDVIYGNILEDDDPFNSPKMRELRDCVERNCHPHNGCRYCFGNWAR